MQGKQKAPLTSLDVLHPAAQLSGERMELFHLSIAVGVDAQHYGQADAV